MKRRDRDILEEGHAALAKAAADAIDAAPHCDARILHAPGECRWCDLYPDWQKARENWGIAYTGHEPDAGQLPCPADVARPPGSPSDHRTWGGNRAAPPKLTVNAIRRCDCGHRVSEHGPRGCAADDEAAMGGCPCDRPGDEFVAALGQPLPEVPDSAYGQDAQPLDPPQAARERRGLLDRIIEWFVGWI